MHVIKKYIEDNDVKNVVILKFKSTPQVDIRNSKNPGATEIAYIIKYLREECNIEPIISSNGSRVPSDGYRYKQYNKIDWESVGLCISQTSVINLFGGVWRDTVINKATNWNDHYHGLTYVMYTDPEILWTNPFRILIDENRTKCGHCPGGVVQDIKPERVGEFDNKNIEGLFIGRDFELFKSKCKPKKHTVWPKISHSFNFVPYMIEQEMNKNKDKPTVIDLLEIESEDIENKTDKIYDIVYFGSDRPGRNKILRSLFKTNTTLNKKWIGYDPKFDKESTTVFDSVSKIELENHLNECKLSFVVGDPAHNNNIFTYRIFENSTMNCLSTIWHEFDPDHYIFKHAELSKFYVSCIEDIESLIKHLEEDSSRLEYYLNLQKNEILKYSKSWK